MQKTSGGRSLTTGPVKIMSNSNNKIRIGTVEYMIKDLLDSCIDACEMKRLRGNNRYVMCKMRECIQKYIRETGIPFICFNERDDLIRMDVVIRGGRETTRGIDVSIRVSKEGMIQVDCTVRRDTLGEQELIENLATIQSFMGTMVEDYMKGIMTFYRK